MDDKFLKTVIFIIKDKATKKPVVITHFQGFKNQEEAEDFSAFLRGEFCLEKDYNHSNLTLH